MTIIQRKQDPEFLKFEMENNPNENNNNLAEFLENLKNQLFAILEDENQRDFYIRTIEIIMALDPRQFEYIENEEKPAPGA